MMLEQHVEYNDYTGTWNLFVNGEWYAEGDYEYIDNMFWNNVQCESEEYDYEEPDYDYESLEY